MRRSVVDRMEALRRANEVRTWIADERRMVERGNVERWCELILSGDERLKSVELLEFLTWLPWVGRGRAHTAIRKVFPYSRNAERRSVARLPLDKASQLATWARRRT